MSGFCFLDPLFLAMLGDLATLAPSGQLIEAPKFFRIEKSGKDAQVCRPGTTRMDSVLSTSGLGHGTVLPILFWGFLMKSI